jgi:hypothetical protein
MMVSFMTPVKFEGNFPSCRHTCLELVDSYFDLGRFFKTKVAAVDYYNPLEKRYYCEKKDSNSPFFVTALKIISYVTIVLPLVAFVLKYIFRSQEEFYYKKDLMSKTPVPPQGNGTTPPPPPPPDDDNPSRNTLGISRLVELELVPSIKERLLSGQKMVFSAEEVSSLKIIERDWFKEANGSNFVRSYSEIEDFKGYIFEVRSKDFKSYELVLKKLPTIIENASQILTLDQFAELLPTDPSFRYIRGSCVCEFTSYLPEFQKRLFIVNTKDFKGFTVTLTSKTVEL